ncbi:MAG: toll/interleukin-1 receptor domain-containing protein [Anaerolineae bacterium]|nr:toll/interleukin-1 receptor domain-containing protein [Anaerolineae bacterium]
MSSSDQFEYDVFISHASEDKESFVRDFAVRLIDFGLKVWYDEFTLDVGDSLIRSIDQGLVKSRFGIVILSNHFLRKAWPEYELKSLLTLQIGNTKRILPIWHDLDRALLLEYSPFLTDLFALNTAKGLDTVVLGIMRVVRPELFQAIVAWLRFQQKVETGEIGRIKASEIKHSPRRRQRLADVQMRRLRIMRALFGEVYERPFSDTYDAFLRDLHVDKEIQDWEWRALVFYLYRQEHELSTQEAQKLFQLLMMADLSKMAAADSKAARNDELERETGLDVRALLAIIQETNRHPVLDEDTAP